MKQRWDFSGRLGDGGYYAVLCIVSIIGWIVVRGTALGLIAERYWSRSIEFAARSASWRDPPLDERIKIFNLYPPQNNQPVAKVSVDVVRRMIGQKPKVLFIDQELLDRDNSDALREMAVDPRQTRLITAGFFARETGDDLANRLVSPDKLQDLRKLEAYDGVSDRGERLYASVSEVQAPFSRIGYIDYEKFGYFEPLRKVDNQYVALHAGILAGENYVFYTSSFEIDRGDLHPTHDLQIPIDLPPHAALVGRTKSLGELSTALNAPNGFNTLVQQGDYVILSVARPLGVRYLPRSLTRDQALAANFNSQLRKSWLKEAPAPWLLLVLAGLLGALIATSTRGPGRLMSIIAAGAAWILFGIVTFSLRGLSIPWLFASLTTWTTGSCLTMVQWYLKKARQKQLFAALTGKVSPAVAAEIAERAAQIGPAQTRLVSFLSLDIRVVPLEEGAEVFENVQFHREILVSHIRNLLWRHHAVIYGSRDDHLLVVFGSSIVGDPTEGNHPVLALDAAVSIQRYLIESTMKSGKIAAFAAIGIETAVASIGALDPQNPWKFGVMSDASGFAGQLRIGCNRYRIMIGPKAAHLIPEDHLADYPKQTKFAKLASGAEVSTCFEITPLSKTQEFEELRLAESLCSRGLHYDRAGKRWQVKDPKLLIWVGEGAHGEILNYSADGLMIRIDKFFAPPTNLSFSIKSPDGAIERLLADHEMDLLVGQVRWAQEESEDRYVHGLQFGSEIKLGHRDLLVGLLADYLRRAETSVDRGA